MKNNQLFADFVLIVFVVAIAAMLVVPLPTALLDILLVLNISLSILLLLVGLFVPNSTTLYTLPTVLLLSTLFRLSLNVASARLILSQGDAGRVIESFGTFLIRGEVVVGMIIFTIVTIVNFIVISKGAYRVSEVAARFALESIPGKQLAIDNDARNGIISADEARRKRDELRRESQLFGSMDGAMKFVQGDAIAGFFIILANIFGGIYLGFASGMGLQDAIQTYTVLTVGDGLVTQIPSLLTSICAGIVVTRVSSSDVATLSADLKSQLFSHPAILIITGLILGLFAMLPGLPPIPFLVVAGASLGLGFLLRRTHQSNPALALTSGDFGRSTGLPAAAQSESEMEFEPAGLTMFLDANVLYRTYKANAGRYLGWWQTFRTDFHAELGLVIPDVRIVPDHLGAVSSFRLESRGIEIVSGSVLPDALFVEVSSSQAAMLGLYILKEEEHPISGHRTFWTPDTSHNRRMMEAAAIRTYDFFEYIALRLAQFSQRHPEEFLSITDVHSLLRQVDKRHPGLVADGFGREFVSVARLTEILQELVRQGVSIRDFRGIIEAVASFCSTSGITVDEDQSVDVAEAVFHIRSVRRRQLVRRFIGSGRSLRVLSLSADVEQVLNEAEAPVANMPLALEDGVSQALTRGLDLLLRPALEMGVVPVAVLCNREQRSKVASLLWGTKRTALVLAFEDLDPSIPVEQVGMWSLDFR